MSYSSSAAAAAPAASPLGLPAPFAGQGAVEAQRGSPAGDSAALGVLVKEAGSLLKGGLRVLGGQLAHSRTRAQALSQELQAQQAQLRKASLYKRSAEKALERLGRRGQQGGQQGGGSGELAQLEGV